MTGCSQSSYGLPALRMNLKFLVVVAVAVVVAGCTTGAQQAGPQNGYPGPQSWVPPQNGHGPQGAYPGPQPPWPTQGRHDFEGIVTYKGRSGPPPGEPMDSV